MKTLTPLVVAMAAAVGAAIGLASLALGGAPEDGYASAALLSETWAFLWLVAAWSASSLARLFPNRASKTLLHRRRAVGLGFAAGHVVHLGFVIARVQLGRIELRPAEIIGGAALTLLVAALALTSNDAAVRRLGPRAWKTLHSFGGGAILAILTLYFAQGLHERPEIAYPALSLVMLALLVRLFASVGPQARAA